MELVSCYHSICFILSGEEYPSVAGAKTYLLANNVFPVFAITSDVTDTFTGLVSSFGCVSLVFWHS